jgi:chromosome segregation ATPase
MTEQMEEFKSPKTEAMMPEIQASVDREKLNLLEDENERLRAELRSLRAGTSSSVTAPDTERLKQRVSKQQAEIESLSKELNKARVKQNQLKDHAKTIMQQHNTFKEQVDGYINQLQEENRGLSDRVA